MGLSIRGRKFGADVIKTGEKAVGGAKAVPLRKQLLRLTWELGVLTGGRKPRRGAGEEGFPSLPTEDALDDCVVRTPWMQSVMITRPPGTPYLSQAQLGCRC